jgi:hypothetical protein
MADTAIRIHNCKELIRELESDLEKGQKAAKYGIKRQKADLADQARWIKEMHAKIKAASSPAREELRSRVSHVEQVTRKEWQRELEEMGRLRAAIPRIKSDLRDKRAYLKELEKKHKAEQAAEKKAERKAGPAPKLAPGYAWEFHPDEVSAEWHSSPDDNWEVVMVSASDTRGATFRGRRTIDGSPAVVFRGADGILYAQKANGGRSPTPARARSRVERPTHYVVLIRRGSGYPVTHNHQTLTDAWRDAEGVSGATVHRGYGGIDGPDSSYSKESLSRKGR